MDWDTDESQDNLLATDTVTANWSDLRALRAHEAKEIIHLSTLTNNSVYVSNLQRQKMSLVLDVFSDRTSAALKISECSADSMKDKAVFIDNVLQ